MYFKTYLWLNQDEVNKEHDKVMLDVFVGEPLAPRALRQSHTLSKSAIVSFAVRGVKGVDWKSAFNAYRHFTTLLDATRAEPVFGR